jgi:hypothetical protein
MTAIERAERFYQRIHLWAGEPDQTRAPSWKDNELDCVDKGAECWLQLRVARVLIKQERDSWLGAPGMHDTYRSGVLEGFREAIKILDAVTGREQ